MSVSDFISEAEQDATPTALVELVRMPLTAIRAAAEILRDHADLSLTERKAFAEAMLVESERLDAIIALFASPGGLIGTEGCAVAGPSGGDR